MSWIYYLLEANLYLLLFYGFYRLLLHKETFYTLNRYYLIISTLTAFLLPLLQASYFNSRHTITEAFTEEPAVQLITGKALRLQAANVPAFNPADLLPYCYLLITILFLAKILMGIANIMKIVQRSKKERAGNITFIKLKGQGAKAFSFFNLLFIDPQLEEQQTVINHELVHIAQKHSLDILFFEIIQAFCWFNPVVYFLKSDVKLLHEYLADELTTHQGNRHEYALFLIRNSFGIPTHQMTNHIFNQSILKRRINMLNKTRTTARARLRLLLLLPLAGTMVCLSTMAFTKSYGMIDLYPEKYSADARQVTPAPTSKTDYFAAAKIDPKTGEKSSTEKKLIVINGKIVDTRHIGAIYNADKWVTLKPAEAIKKYGTTGQYGAFELTGADIKITDEFTMPPPPVQDSGNYNVTWKLDPATGKMTLKDKRLLVIDGVQYTEATILKKVVGGVRKASKIHFLPAAEGQKKYGSAAKFGAVEVTGDHIEIIKRYPPPVIYPDSTFYTKWRYDKNQKKAIPLEKRLIIVNGKIMDDISAFGGVKKAAKLSFLNAKQATEKYGDRGKFGAVEITGDHLELLKPVSEPPPPRAVPQPAKKSTKRFPPPVVVPDKKDAVKFPPPVVKQDKKDAVKFPPPVVKQDKKDAVKFPPPVVKQDKKDAVKFPPPIVKRDKKDAVKFPPPVVKEKDSVKFPPPVVKQDKKAGGTADLKNL